MCEGRGWCPLQGSSALVSGPQGDCAARRGHWDTREPCGPVWSRVVPRAQVSESFGGLCSLVFFLSVNHKTRSLSDSVSPPPVPHA